MKAIKFVGDVFEIDFEDLERIVKKPETSYGSFNYARHLTQQVIFWTRALL